MYKETKYLTAGDKALTIEYGNEISEDISSKVRSMMVALEINKIDGIVEIVPTYRSLMVHYNPLIIGYDKLVNKLKSLENKLEDISLPEPEVIEIPTVYGGEYGPDIGNVAKHNKITVEEVVKIHSSKEYLIYMLGFTPGFPYLGGMNGKIATPRLKSPRTKINKGSVGIAGSQTGIYPIDSPGGWQLIGKTPLKLYEPNREVPILLKAGNYIKFVPIFEGEYKSIEKAVNNGTYKYNTYIKKSGERS
ncbi:5-oxoprolinase subunit PxpB [Clostridium tetani]|uniref:5-oxoprolinase subunit PxpB n=1 Tax=Clostridium tetani TaxID=1513 RepID=UPI00051307AC|nr:5-oxoprolinase subunit PxpB [Clostridium tetani]KGI38536.1 allophanate hydrolase [Clostridium tetani ATCC 9441]KGI41654.1 allophanate hydrolase [Clostridium tetani]RXM73425.1 allophanate hydrolase subunit 1 [Clostridium tetani]SUY65692.1 allophanate hydrolase subunit 1 [Clostridium tetani]BDR85884.1 allophanate hydrolase [Clostridium tetani]